MPLRCPGLFLYDCCVRRPIIQRYAESQEDFFADFSAAFVKLSMAGAVWKPRPSIVIPGPV